MSFHLIGVPPTQGWEHLCPTLDPTLLSHIISHGALREQHIRNILIDATAFVSPAFIRSGVKTKNAMVLETGLVPLVTSSEGVRGLFSQPNTQNACKISESEVCGSNHFTSTSKWCPLFSKRDEIHNHELLMKNESNMQVLNGRESDGAYAHDCFSFCDMNEYDLSDCKGNSNSNFINPSLIIADSADSFAKAVIQLYDEPKTAIFIAKNGQLLWNLTHPNIEESWSCKKIIEEINEFVSNQSIEAGKIVTQRIKTPFQALLSALLVELLSIIIYFGMILSGRVIVGELKLNIICYHLFSLWC